MRWAWVFLLFTACVNPLAALRLEKPLEIERHRLLLKHDGTLPEDVARLERAVEKALPVLAEWGGLAEPVTVFLVNDHDALEEAVHRPGYSWLRAWGRYDEIIFQAPSTWTRRDEPVDQLVLHELSHCLLFQRSASKKDWLEKEIPLWFREGMAISIARQANQYPNPVDSGAWLMKNPTLDVFKDGEALSQDRSAEVYAVGFHAFVFLENQSGREKIVAIMDAMRSGETFEAAFARTIGVSVDAFRVNFENDLKFRAFRYERRSRIQRPTMGAPATEGQGT